MAGPARRRPMTAGRRRAARRCWTAPGRRMARRTRPPPDRRGRTGRPDPRAPAPPIDTETPMTPRTLVLALLAPCLLAACANETAIPEATDSAAARTTAAAASKPSAPVTAFDG